MDTRIRKLFVIAMVIVLCGNSFVNAQELKFPYPIIFVHGWTGNDEGWTEIVNALGGQARVFDACLNHDGSAATASLTNDVYILGWRDENTKSPTGLYLLNFDHTKFPGTEHTEHVLSNQSAIFKQGYALGKAIEAVLVLEPDAEKVVLIGHSMGGLTIREYLQRDWGGNWVNPDSNDGHKVAKAVTIGTPHRGSNFMPEWVADILMPIVGFVGELAGYDNNSEAVRDLRWNYDGVGVIGVPGKYLYGGGEYTAPFNYYNSDINCDGDVNDEIIGINQPGDGTIDNPSMPLPTNMAYTWIIGKSTFWPGCSDLVVDCDRQWLFNNEYLSAPLNVSDTISIISSDPIYHLNERENLVGILRGLDEPSNKELAYRIKTGPVYKGYTTLGSNSQYNDIDVFEWIATGYDDITVSVGSNANLLDNISVRDQNWNLISNNSGTLPAELTIDNPVPAESYYIIVEGTPIGDPFNSQYFLRCHDHTPPKVVPEGFEFTNSLGTNILIEMSEPIDKSALNSSNVIVQGSISGLISCVYSFDNNVITINPNNNFVDKEVVSLTLTTSITDLSGNCLDGDGNGIAGPNYTNSFIAGGYTHDYALNSITLSNSNPVVGQMITILGVVRNEGIVTEPANQRVYLYDNEIQRTYLNIPEALDPGEEYNVQLSWTATEGAHNLKLSVELTGDENNSNNERSVSVYPGTEGSLRIDGDLNPTRSITLSPGNTLDAVLQLGNVGSATVNATVAKGGEISNWLTLTTGTSVSIPRASTLSYNFRITVPTVITTYRVYTGYITFSYENGNSATVQINLSVIQYNPGYFPCTLSSGSVLINGAVADPSDIFIQDVDYLDNNPSTSYPTMVPTYLSYSQAKYNTVNKAIWSITADEIMPGSLNSRLRLSIPEGEGSMTYYSDVTDADINILGWLVNGFNTMRLSLDYFTHDASDVLWSIGTMNSTINLQYSQSAFGASCPVSDPETKKDGLDYCRIYFHVDDVQVPGDLILCRSGQGSVVATRSIDASDEGETLYFSLTSSEFDESNYYSIKGDPDDDTRAYISSIRFEIKYFQGDPNLICSKSISKSAVSVNEDVTINLSFNNMGDNIADEPRFNDSPLPSGLVLVSGSLSGDPGDIRPGETGTASYVIRAQIPGQYTFGATTVTYEDYANNDYSTSFNAVSLTVNGGALLVTGSSDVTEVEPGLPVLISASVREPVNNNIVTDAQVKCIARDVATQNLVDEFFLIYDLTTSTYRYSFTNTMIPGDYELHITAEKAYYLPGVLGTPLLFTVIGPPYLNVHPLSQNVIAEEGNVTFNISTNQEWTATEDQEWLTLTIPDNEHLVVNYSVNPEFDSRNGLITITGGQLQIVVIISQEGLPLAVPDVTSINAFSIAKSSAQSGGQILSDGGAAVIARGVCWSVNPSPTVALPTRTSDGSGIGSFSSEITGLMEGTTYYVRAYGWGSLNAKNDFAQVAIADLITAGTVRKSHDIILSDGVAAGEPAAVLG